MTAKFEPKPPKLSDAERHKRLVEMAHEVESSEDARDFERAFMDVVQGTPAQPADLTTNPKSER